MVVAIIAALAALAMGLYRRTKGQRVQLESAARMQQWGAALASYIADNDGTLPRRGQGVQEVTQLDRPEDWFNALPPVGSRDGRFSFLHQLAQPPPPGLRRRFAGIADGLILRQHQFARRRYARASTLPPAAREFHERLAKMLIHRAHQCQGFDIRHF